MLSAIVHNFLKARGYPVGTVRIHGGRKVVKQADGKWKPLKVQRKTSKKKTAKKTAKRKVNLRELADKVNARGKKEGREGGTIHFIQLDERGEITEFAARRKKRVKKINERDKQTGIAPLHKAIEERRKLPTIKKLLDQGANVNIQSYYGGSTPLIEAVEAGRPSLVKLLLEHGAKIDLPNSFGLTPLHWAIGNNNKTMTRLLLRYGADPHIKNDDGLSSIGYAMLKGHRELANLIYRHVKKKKKAV